MGDLYTACTEPEKLLGTDTRHTAGNSWTSDLLKAERRHAYSGILAKTSRLLVHGDDYMAEGDKEDLKWLEKKVRERFEIKAEYPGPDEGESQELRILNRVIRWTPSGIEYEADPRHQDIIVSELGLKGGKGIAMPGMKSMPKEDDFEDELIPTEATRYRAITARVNFLAQDRADLLYSAKECSRSMAQPTREDWARLKRIGRYLIRRPRVVVKYAWQSTEASATGNTKAALGFSDADWAGCPRTRRSTSGGTILLGNHWLKACSKTQATAALSSAESELYAMVKTSNEVLGTLSLLKDFGMNIGGSILGDASACLGVIQRQGLGKLRHLNTNYLWVQ